jgi:hypothetical protein
MSDLTEHDDYLQIAVPAWGGDRDHNISDSAAQACRDRSTQAKRTRPARDVSKLQRWIHRLLIVLVLLCLALAAWVWFGILWGP